MTDADAPCGLKVAGWASRAFEQDLIGDQVAPGAFAASLARTGAAGVAMLFRHDPAAPIGRWTKLSERAEGLWAEGVLDEADPTARGVAALIRAHALDGLSIGFRARRSCPRAGGRLLLEIDLLEISLVAFPLLPSARIVRAEPLETVV